MLMVYFNFVIKQIMNQKFALIIFLAQKIKNVL